MEIPTVAEPIPSESDTQLVSPETLSPRGRRARAVPDISELGLESKSPDLVEKVVFINRSAKVVKGGRRFHFSALVVVGDKNGRVGIATGKAGEVADAIKRGTDLARANMVAVPLKDGTIPHEIYSEFDGAKVLMRPASPGTGIIAGRTVRAVLEAAGVRDVLTKSLGSNNPTNVVKATLRGLLRLRQRETIYQQRGLPLKTPSPEAPAASAP
jgi:small subunit ribosomal protein S5